MLACLAKLFSKKHQKEEVFITESFESFGDSLKEKLETRLNAVRQEGVLAHMLKNTARAYIASNDNAAGRVIGTHISEKIIDDWIVSQFVETRNRIVTETFAALIAVKRSDFSLRQVAELSDAIRLIAAEHLQALGMWADGLIQNNGRFKRRLGKAHIPSLL